MRKSILMGTREDVINRKLCEKPPRSDFVGLPIEQADNTSVHPSYHAGASIPNGFVITQPVIKAERRIETFNHPCLGE